ncbi:hypothetical protein B0I37DRAFT_1043 [Chaetomium sp. MPI-CAGE-AT-0009]|nr:hypothetical protein B0I37DRAFT_1043 [Chaetomium sp. MPI-CAGE-AT-0009]
MWLTRWLPCRTRVAAEEMLPLVLESLPSCGAALGRGGYFVPARFGSFPTPPSLARTVTRQCTSSDPWPVPPFVSGKSHVAFSSARWTVRRADRQVSARCRQVLAAFRG